MSDARGDELRALGSAETRYPTDAPDAGLLERFANPAARSEGNPAGAAMALRVDAPEFTTLCPITGQPDWARIVIRYQPDAWCVESKSLKLYLGSWRNHGAFHEATVNRICNDLVALLDPYWLVVEGRFTPRGGIPIWPVSLYRRADRPESGQQRDQYDLLEPMTEKMDRAGRREDVL